MSKVTNNFGNPVQGISQQTMSRRMPNQCRDQVNFTSDLMDGLKTRPSLRVTKELSLTPSNDTTTKWHYYKRDDGEEYIMAFQDNEYYVTDTDGVECIIDTAGFPDYIRTSDPRRDIVAETIGDTTIVVNKGVSPLMDSDIPTYEHRSYMSFHFRVTDAGRLIKITPSGVPTGNQFQYDTGTGWVDGGGDGAPITDIQLLDTSKIAAAFWAYINAATLPSTSGGSSVTNPYAGQAKRIDNWVHVYTLESCDVQSGGSDDDIRVTDNIVSKIEDLPDTNRDGAIVQVTNTGDVDVSEAWFQAETKSGISYDKVKYTEVSHPEEEYKIQDRLMPHKIERAYLSVDVGHFTHGEISYLERKAGSDNGNEPPAFIGRTISSLGLFQNRLFFTSGQHVIMSCTDDYYNFWYASSQYTADDDPIDVLMDSKQVNTIGANVFLDGDIIFFGEDQQSLMLGASVQSSNTASLSPTSNYKVNLDSQPVASGDNVFFANDYGSYTGINEYMTADIVDTKKAVSVTTHVERLIEGSAHHMATSTTINTLVVLTPEAGDTAYIFDWRYQEGERKQSSWSKWVLPTGYSWEWVGFSGSKLIAVIKGFSSYTLCSMEFDDVNDNGLPFDLRLDLKMDVVVLEDGEGDLYIPYVHQSSDGLVVYSGNGSEEPGFPVDYSLSDGNMMLSDDIIKAGDIVHVGYPMHQKYYWNNPVIRDSNGNPQNIDRLTVQQINLTFAEVGEIERVHESPGRAEFRKPFNGRRVGMEGNDIGVVATGEAEWKYPIRRKVDGLVMGIESFSPYPTILTDVEWVADYKQRGRRR